MRTTNAWGSVSRANQIGFAVAAVLVAAFANTADRWVPILDGANLMFHEAGHVVVGAFSQNIGVYGGTMGQLFFPLLAGIHFYRLRLGTSLAFASLWFCQNLWNISRYMADARAQELPLVGGGDHDWTEIFSRWNVLQQDIALANRVSEIAWVVLVITAVLLFRAHPNTRRTSNPER